MANEMMVKNEEKALPIASMLKTEGAKKRFEEVLDKRAAGFVSSLLSIVNNNKLLAEADPKTVMSAAMQAATLNLPINPNLGLAYIVPYNRYDKDTRRSIKEAQFQMGWKGYVQLAERSGQYKTINASIVYEGQVEDIDFITGEIIRGKKVSDKVIGYVAYIELVNGFRKTMYMTKDEMEQHAMKFSQTYKKGFGVWKDNFNAMALKTVLKLLIAKYGIMSIDMQTSDMASALTADQAVIKEDGSFDYIDNKKDVQTIEVESVPLEEAPKAVTSKPQRKATKRSDAPAPEDFPPPLEPMDGEDNPGF